MTQKDLENSQNYHFLPDFFLSVWRVYFPFPVWNGAENNMVGFALKENDSFCWVQYLVSLRCACLLFKWHRSLEF